MQVNINSKAGYYHTEETVINAKDDKFDIKIKINDKGEVEITGAGNVVVEIPHSDDHGEIKDPLVFKIGGGGMEDCPEVSVYGCSSLFKRPHCLIFAVEDEKAIVKARDGLGSWSKQFFFPQEEKK